MPWKISTKSKALTVDDENGCRVAQCSKDANVTDKQIENARLIAAAPAMLEGLKDAHPFISCDIMRAKIGKLIINLEGES